MGRLCSADVLKSKDGKELKQFTGVDNKTLISYYTSAYSKGELKEEFKKWATDNNRNIASGKPLASAIVDYYNEIKKIPTTLNTDRNTRIFKYTSVFEREEGKLHLANYILKQFVNNTFNNVEIKSNKLIYYTAKARGIVNKTICEQIASLTNKSLDEVKTEFKNAESRLEYIETSFKNNKNKTTNNLTALYRELNSSSSVVKNIMEEVLSNPILNSVVKSINEDNTSDYVFQQAIDGNNDLLENNPSDKQTDNEDLDSSIMNLNNHIGTYSNFMSHISDRIKNYFNTLPVMNTPVVTNGKGDEDTNNTYGLPFSMDAQKCCTMLYSKNTLFTNKSEMIKVIENIANTVKGFESFGKFAYDLKNNADFATEVFSNFAKTVIPKMEVVLENKDAKTRISNKEANPKSSLIFSLKNDVKGTILNVDKNVMNTLITNINDSTSALLRNKNILNSSDSKNVKLVNDKIYKLTNDLINVLKSFYPSIDENSIISYIDNNGNGLFNVNQKLININNLNGILKDVVNNIDNANTAYISMRQEMNETGKYSSTTDYTKSQDKAIQQLVNEILPYSSVNIAINSRNAYGNQSSDVINNSYMTKLYKLMSDNYTEYLDREGNVTTDISKAVKKRLRNKNLEEWGRVKLLSKQFKYNNIILEQYDSNGNAINNAIFRYDNGTLVITEHAEYLLNTYLFNGVSNVDNGSNALYSKMRKGDYLPTSFINFFKATSDGAKFKVANYFTRTPSDAPKIFTVQSVRYSTSDLFKIRNKEELDNEVNKLSNDYRKITKQEYIKTYRPNKGTRVTSDKLTDIITKKNNIRLTNSSNYKVIDAENNIASISYVLSDDKLKLPEDRVYVVTGKIVEKNGNKTLTKVKLEGVVGTDENTSDIHNVIKSNIISYNTEKVYNSKLVNYKINKDSPVFQMFRNQFKQEMLDAAVALHHYFKLDNNGNVVLDEDGNNIPRPVLKTNDAIGYKFYHLGKNGRVLEPIIKNGKIINYKLGGAVFSSNKFTLNIPNENGILETKNYLEEVFDNEATNTDTNGNINLLYGSINNGLKILFDNGYFPSDIEFSEAQQNHIDECIESFLNDYSSQAFNEVNHYKQFIQGVSTSRENINDFAVNTLLMNYNYDSFIEGNTKFYKDSQTVLKRAKEGQASGVPYGIADYNEADDVNTHDIENSELNSLEVQNKFKDTILSGVKQRNKFKAVTIKNSVKTNTSALNELIYELIGNSGLDRESATELLYGPVQLDKNGNPIIDKETGLPKRRGGFTETIVNDAQSYITFQEWVRRISARGQLSKYMPLIEKLMDENATITAKDISEFVQVQKNIYYDLHYDAKYGIEVPRQIKNAEFVLVPRFIKGTELEDVYDLMISSDIDQLNTQETSKAANENVTELWDNDKNLLLNNDNKQLFISKFKSNASDYSYNYLYTQQESPQHMNSSNKAGIQFMKKIIDNLTEDDVNRKNFFDIYSTNIKESFTNLMKEINCSITDNGDIMIDENGNIKEISKELFFNKLKDELSRQGLDSNNLNFVKLNEHGNSIVPSFMSYSIDKFESIIQSIFNSNISRQKLPGFHAEQVTNTGFKNKEENTTYKNKETGDLIDKNYYNNLSEEDKSKYINTSTGYNSELRYHPVINGEVKPYIEIMLPYSAFGIDKNSQHYKNMTDEEIIKELEDKGIDIIIGYRIPTEGKQSMCNMKVVKFLDDAQGSTIIVPDDWVSQTGSDFDIDSVYGINYNLTTNAKGELFKKEYVEKPTKESWLNYIHKGNDNVSKSEIFNILNNKEVNAYKFMMTEATFPDNLAKAIKDKFNLIIQNSKLVSENKNEIYKYQLKEYANLIDDLVSSKKNRKILHKNSLTVLESFRDACINLHDFLNNSFTDAQIKSNTELSELFETHAKDLNHYAKQNGKLSFEDYKQSFDNGNAPSLNNRDARTNKLVDTIRDVLMSNKNLEENLSRSNCDDIVEALNKNMNPNIKLERNGRSAYNPFDQMSFQEDAMSGADLKALSVMYDTFCSVCNIAKAKLAIPVKVIYNTKDFKNPKESIERFNGKANKKLGDTFTILHDMYGHSNDNRSVNGKILTSYSSQTTAYILDAIKSGAIPNVNTYTFIAFKTLVNLGIDYNTTISYIMQPGISNIVNSYNTINSIYSTTLGNPINNAIKNVAKQLGIKFEKHDTTDSILEQINEKYKEQFNKIFNIDNSNELSINLEQGNTKNIPLIVTHLTSRLNNSGIFAGEDSETNKLLFDLGTILSFNNINIIGNKTNSIAGCLTTDKNGAKQSVFATIKLFKDIDKAVNGEFGVADSSPILSVNGKHLLEAVYPGVSKDNLETYGSYGLKNILTTNRIDESVYPTLYSFLKYGSATSIAISRNILETQNEKFVSLIDGFASALGVESLDEKTYKSAQKYVLNYFYNLNTSIVYPISYNLNDKNAIKNIEFNVSSGIVNVNGSDKNYSVSLKGDFAEIYIDNGIVKVPVSELQNSISRNKVIIKVGDNEVTIPLDLNEIKRNERKRIFGYGYPQSMSTVVSVTKTRSDGTSYITNEIKTFTINDVNHPTKEEINEFIKLTPAQKVVFIKSNFDNNNIFKYINAQLYNERNRGSKAGMQTIEYVDNQINPNIIYNEFYKAFHSNNPLIANAAYDLVKYNFQVDGNNISRTGIAKAINNIVFAESIENNGTNLVEDTTDMITSVGNNDNPLSNLETIQQLHENFVRSHYNDLNLKTLRLYSNNVKELGIQMKSLGVIVMELSNDETLSTTAAYAELQERLVKAGFITKTETGQLINNTFIKVVTPNGISELYKIYNRNDYVIAYPINKLEYNENDVFSANSENNTHPGSILFEKLIREVEHNGDINDLSNEYISKAIAESRGDDKIWYKKTLNYAKVASSISFNINELAKEGGGMSILKNTIINHFSNIVNSTPLMVNSAVLNKYIFNSGEQFGIKQFIPEINKSVIINKVDTTKGDAYYLNSSISKEERQSRIDTISNSTIKTIYTNANNINLKRASNLFVITPEVETLHASTEELDLQAMDYINMHKSTSDSNLEVQIIEKLRANGVQNLTSSIANNIEFATQQVASYAKNKSEELIHNFNNFVVDPLNPNNVLSILDPRVQEEIIKDNNLLAKYFKTINELSAFKTIFSPYINSNDDKLKFYFDDIKKSVNAVLGLDIDKAENNLASNYIKNMSTNPILTSNLISVMDNYYKTYGSMWMFSDIMDNGNPLLQIILKDVYGDLESKRMMQERRSREFSSKVDEIKRKAKENGHTLNIDSLIDEHGKFIQDYTPEFVDELESLMQAKRDANKLGKGYGGIEYLRAKNNYDSFLAKHVNQEANPIYYATKATLDKHMIDNYPEIFSKYMDLKYKLYDKYRYLAEVNNSEEVKQEIYKIKRQIQFLVKGDVYLNENNELVQRPVKEPNVEYSKEFEENYKIYSHNAKNALSKYIGDIKENNDKYFYYDANYGFEDQLRANLNIIESMEQRGANGLPTVPADILESNTLYNRAKDWISANARFVIDNVAVDGDDESDYKKLKKAIAELSLSSNVKTNASNEIMSLANEGNGITDSKGIINGKLLTDDERARIKTVQESKNNISNMPMGTDRILINSAPKSNVIYTSSFYAGMSGSGKIQNVNYLNTVTELNKILSKYYDNVDNIIHFDRIPNTEEGIKELKEINRLYELARAYKGMAKTSTSKGSNKEFIKKNVEFVNNLPAFRSQLLAAVEKGVNSEYYDLWCKINLERDENGNYVQSFDKDTKETKSKPNSLIYSYAKPKGNVNSESYNKFVDKRKTDNINTVNKYYNKVKTKYYYEAMREAILKAETDSEYNYETWYNANHTYNPYTHSFEPIECWTTSELNYSAFGEDSELKGQWNPTRAQSTRLVKEPNPNYKENVPISQNYVVGSQKGKYDNPIQLNDYEKEMKTFLQNTLMSTARTDSSRKYFAKDYIPSVNKAEEVNKATYLKEIGKMFGFNIHNTSGNTDEYSVIDYTHDVVPFMPGTKELSSKSPKQATTMEDAIALLDTDETIKFTLNRPIRGAEESLDDYKKRNDEYSEIYDKVRNHNRKVSESLMSRDVYKVIEDYLNESSNYNAIQDNKEKLYYLLNMLRKQQAYMRKYNGSGDLKVDTRKSTENATSYQTDVDKNLITQYENVMRRLLWDQWKEPEGKLTRFANGLQGFTSANFMMLNVRGGIANVTLGFTGIFGEAAAGEQFNNHHWRQALTEGSAGSISYLRGLYDTKGYSKQDAIFKLFKAVDYDEVTGVSTQLSLEQWSERMRNLMFSPQSSGEFLMQNSVLLAMLLSHKIVPINNDPKGIGFRAVPKKEYVAMKQQELLTEILTKEQQEEYIEFLNEIKSDANKAKDYAWFRKDALTDFIYLNGNKEQIKKFKKLREDQQELIEKEFDELHDMYSQMELKNGYVAFKEGSILSQLDEYPSNDKNENVTKAYAILGMFGDKVRKTNNKIHGVYNKQGRAYLEKKWYGSLIMQYHKHLPVGLLKRYAVRGHWNEVRSAVDKGMIASFNDFISLNFRKTKADYNLTEENVAALESVQNVLKFGVAFCSNLRNTYFIMPEYDRANMRRNLGDLVGVLAGIMTTIVLLAAGDDDDDGLLYNLSLYEADRLSSEAFMYNPIGMVTEGKKLMSTPLAAQTIINDAFKSCYEIGGMIYQGKDFDPIYHSGRFAGDDKVSVYIQRRIPMWSSVRSLTDIASNNKYYKVGTTASTIIPTKDIADWIKKQ